MIFVAWKDPAGRESGMPHSRPAWTQDPDGVGLGATSCLHVHLAAPYQLQPQVQISPASGSVEQLPLLQVTLHPA
jgi:hypothetical protein